jgi:hypothetical protein
MGRIIVFYARQDNNASEPDGFVVRVRAYGANAAQTAAQGVSSAAQTAAAGVSKGVRQGVYSTRVWAAPQLESAADYTVTTVAPKVSSALRSTAQQIRPVDVTPKKSRSMLTWSVLAAAIVATAGAVTAAVMYRLRSSVDVETDEEFSTAGPASTASGAGSAGGAESRTGGAESSTTAGSSTAGSAGDSTDAGVNGRVSTSGW